MKTKSNKSNNGTIIAGAVCAKDHSGNHQLAKNGKAAECCGCGEFYTFAEIARAQPHTSMLARGVRAVEVAIK